MLMFVKMSVKSAYLCLDDVPGISQAYVVFWVVKSQPIFQILLSILAHLEIKTTPVWLETLVFILE